MHSVSKRRTGFTVSSLYRLPHERALDYMTERATFWIAALSVFAFVTGNMVGQHGWHVFWKSVLGEGSESTIVFDGTVTPIALIPDYDRWTRFGGDVHVHTFKQVPKDLLVPLPSYAGNGAAETSAEERVYFVKHLGTYDTGRGEGSHPGVDIAAPIGTPVRSIANGVVTAVTNDAGGYGLYVTIKHPNVPDSSGKKVAYYSTYAHLSAQLITEGTVVTKGQEIGLTGQTGFATGPHLHFQVDKDTAPWHPYWLFTSKEATDEGYSFTKAVDKGLHRERGLEYTVDSMLFVQSYQSGVPNVRVAEARSSSSSSRKTTIADRRAERLARRGIDNTTLIAFTEDAPVTPIPAPVTHPAAPVAVAETPVATPVTAKVMDVSSVRIELDDSRTREREWKTVKIRLVDAEGNLIENPVPGRKMALRAAFGKAEFKPSAFSTGDFRNGVLAIQVLPLGSQTLVLEVVPFGVLSKPMKMER